MKKILVLLLLLVPSIVWGACRVYVHGGYLQNYVPAVSDSFRVQLYWYSGLVKDTILAGDSLFFFYAAVDSTGEYGVRYWAYDAANGVRAFTSYTAQTDCKFVDTVRYVAFTFETDTILRPFEVAGADTVDIRLMLQAEGYASARDAATAVRDTINAHAPHGDNWASTGAGGGSDTSAIRLMLVNEGYANSRDAAIAVRDTINAHAPHGDNWASVGAGGSTDTTAIKDMLVGNLWAAGMDSARLALDRRISSRLAPAVLGRTLAVNADGRAGIDFGVITGQLTFAHFANSAFINAHFEDGFLTATKIASNAITAAKIATDAITADKIAAGAITSSEAPNLDVAVSTRLAPGGTLATVTTVDGFSAAAKDTMSGRINAAVAGLSTFDHTTDSVMADLSGLSVEATLPDSLWQWLQDILDDIGACAAGACGGVGVETTTVYVLAEEDSLPVVGARTTYFSGADKLLALTDSTGRVTFAADAGTWAFAVKSIPRYFPVTYIPAGIVDTVYGVAPIFLDPSDTTLTSVCGYVYDLGGNPLGATVRAEVRSSVVIGNVLVSRYFVETTSDSVTGAWQLNLYPTATLDNKKYRFSVAYGQQQIYMKDNVIVPDTTGCYQLDW